MSEVSLVKELAKQRDIPVIEKPNGHIQLLGPLMVNYFPLSKAKSAYVNGTVKGVKGVTPEKAIEMCFTPPECNGVKDSRKGSSRNRRIKLMNRGVDKCHWCEKPLTIDSSTLEHIIPLSRGGLDNDNNTTLACAPCNNNRGSEMPEIDCHKKQKVIEQVKRSLPRKNLNDGDQALLEMLYDNKLLKGSDDE